MTLVCGKVGKRALIASTQGALEPLDAALHADSTLALLREPQKKSKKWKFTPDWRKLTSLAAAGCR
jgi:hypothetical protein